MKTIYEGEKKVIDLTIKLLVIVLLIAWCFKIILPFLIPILWGAILAITLFPLYKKLSSLMKGKKVLASVIISGILVIILIIPTIWMIATIVKEVKEMVIALHNNTLVIPPANEKIAKWTLIGKPIYDAWNFLATNTESALVTYREQILGAGQKLAGSMLNVTSNVLIFVLSVIISGVFLVIPEKSQKSALSIATRLAGDTGAELLEATVQTIRNVAKGILGVAFIQFILMGVCLVLADVPLAGLWALAVLLLAIVQLPTALVGIPVVIYLFSAKEPLPALLWTVFILIVSLSDNVLKPLLMGKGAPVPMLVIFLGAIGGFIMSGFIGLFIGAIVLSIGYKLAGLWLVGGKSE
jgi:predicted PurR-regulated permease PerM